MDYMRSDAILMEILCQRKTLTGFLDAVFGFLRRNTDFYDIKEDESENFGFLRGMREEIVNSAMQQYDPEAFLYNLAAAGNGGFGECAPPASAEEVVCNEEEKMYQDMQKLRIKDDAETFAPSDYYNGAVFDDYCWSQTIKDIEIHLKLPDHLKSGRLIDVEFKPDGLTVRSNNDPAEILLDGELSEKYKYSNGCWLVLDEILVINIDKLKEAWWEKLFVTEDVIDVKKLKLEPYFDELPDESQAAISKVVVDAAEKEAAENSTLQKMRIAWDAEGSPFKGQPFDPSILQFQ